MNPNLYFFLLKKEEKEKTNLGKEMDEVFRRLDDIQCGARIFKRPNVVQYTHSGTSVVYLAIVLALTFLLFLLLYFWPR